MWKERLFLLLSTAHYEYCFTEKESKWALLYQSTVHTRTVKERYVRPVMKSFLEDSGEKFYKKKTKIM